MQTTDQTVARAKGEILEDVADGIVPATITAACDLHDYVDANEYGGMCEDDFTPAGGDLVDHAIEVFRALHTWIASGDMAREAVA